MAVTSSMLITGCVASDGVNKRSKPACTTSAAASKVAKPRQSAPSAARCIQVSVASSTKADTSYALGHHPRAM